MSKNLSKALQKARWGSDGSVRGDGRAAFFANKSRAACPYSDLDRREAWLKGWDEAQAEAADS